MRLSRIAYAICILVVAAAPCFAQMLKPCDLMKLMLGQDEEAAQRGIAGFVQMGPMAAVPLVCFVSGKAPGCPDPTDLGKKRGEIALVKLGQAAVPAILERLNTPDDEFRTRLVRVLGQIKDIRRERPIMGMWDSEKSDRVRGVLPEAVMALKKPGENLPILSQRIPKAGPRELHGLALEFAVYDAGADLARVLDRIDPAKRSAFLTGLAKALSQRGDGKSKAAVSRVEALREGE